jgi:hypothetical protein
MHVPRFFIRQKITMMVNRYEIRGAGPDGGEGPLLAFAQQKRMKRLPGGRGHGGGTGRAAVEVIVPNT